jgi:hypothetical protein
MMTSEAKFTPGPWEYVKPEMLSHDAPGYEVQLAPGGILGGTEDDPSWVIEGEIEHKPNALLIAAAPQLYEAVVGLLAICPWRERPGKNHPEIDAALAALREARGLSEHQSDNSEPQEAVVP